MASASTTVAAGTLWADWMRSGRWKESADTAIPLLPVVAHEIVDLALDPEVSTAQVVAIVSKDPVLATRVIQLANSAFSASAKEISSIHEAVGRLGTGLVRNVITSACLSAPAADPQVYGRQGRQYVDHSIGTAYTAWLIAEAAMEPPAEAFLYGLLHDLGKLLVIKLARQASRYSVIPPNENELAVVLAEQHAAIGGYLLEQWDLPGRLYEPIVWHHEPERAKERPDATLVAYAANRFSHRYGFACPLDDFDPLADPLLEQIGIDEAAVARLDEQAPALYDMARKLRY